MLFCILAVMSGYLNYHCLPVSLMQSGYFTLLAPENGCSPDIFSFFVNALETLKMIGWKNHCKSAVSEIFRQSTAPSKTL